MNSMKLCVVLLALGNLQEKLSPTTVYRFVWIIEARFLRIHEEHNANPNSLECLIDLSESHGH